jgi:hypothetical protein
MMRLKLEQGGQAGAVFDLPEGETVVGRSHSAQLRVEADDVSGRHVCLRRKGAMVELENLSRYGTYVDGEPVNGRVPLRSGQSLAIGRHVVLRFEADAESAPAAPVAAGEAPTAGGGAVAADATRAAPLSVPATGRTAGDRKSGTLAPARAEEPAGLEFTRGDLGLTAAAGGLNHDQTMEGMTRAMQTRAASIEEIEFLRAQEQKRARQRQWLMVLTAGGVLILALIFWPRPPPPEKVLEWPVDAKGNYLDAMLDGPSGGTKAGGYALAFPGTKGWVKQELPADKTNGKGFYVETHIARDLSVPLRLGIVEEVAPELLTQDRRSSLQRKLEQLSKVGGSWNFDPPSPVFFLGGENGVPAVAVSYQRETKTGTWYGTITYFRYGPKQVTLMAEVPASERLRAEAFLGTKFLDISREYERGHWEGSSETVKTSVADLLRQARIEMERNAPATWAKVEVLLMAAVRQANLAGDRDRERDCMQQLRRLRERQNDWFNGQKIAYLNAQTLGKSQNAIAIAEQCKAVFSNDEDRRFYIVRRQEW